MRRKILAVTLAVTAFVMLTAEKCPGEAVPSNPPAPAATGGKPPGPAPRGTMAFIVRFDPPDRVHPIGISYVPPGGLMEKSTVAYRSPWYAGFPKYTGEYVYVIASQVTAGTVTCIINVNDRQVATQTTTSTRKAVKCDYSPPVGRDNTG